MFSLDFTAERRKNVKCFLITLNVTLTVSYSTDHSFGWIFKNGSQTASYPVHDKLHANV